MWREYFKWKETQTLKNLMRNGFMWLLRWIIYTLRVILCSISLSFMDSVPEALEILHQYFTNKNDNIISKLVIFVIKTIHKKMYGNNTQSSFQEKIMHDYYNVHWGHFALLEKNILKWNLGSTKNWLLNPSRIKNRINSPSKNKSRTF